MNTNRTGRIFYGWIIVLCCVALSAGSGILTGVASVFIKPVSEALHVSRSAFTLYTTLSMTASMVVLPLVPNLFKRFSFKRLVTGGCIAAGAALFCFSFAGSLYAFYAIAVICGIAACFMNAVPIVILTSNWFIEKRGAATSISFSGMGISSIILSPVATRIIIDYGWQSAYRVLGVIFLALTLPVVMFLVKEKPSELGLRALGDEQACGGTAEKKPSGFTRREAIRTKSFWLFAIGIILSSMIAYGIQQHLVSYLSDIGYMATAAASWLSIMTVVATVSKAITGPVYDRFGIVKATVAFSLLLLASFIFLIGAARITMLLLFILLFGISSGLQIIPPTYMTNKFFGDRDYSANYGLVTTIYYLGMASGIQLSSFSFDRFGSYVVAWIVYAALTVFMLYFWLRARVIAIEERRRLLGEQVDF